MRHALGEFEHARNASGVLIAAPHGSFDANTAPIAIQAAREVFETYAKLAGNPGRLYVEIHGNSNPHTARNIEVATVGITAAQARALKASYPEMLRQSGLPDLVLLIEPVDRITYSAACAKKLGTLGQVPRALHFEFPRSARETTNLSRAARLVAMIARRLLEL